MLQIIIQYAEWIGFVFGVLQVVYAVKNNSINFVFGLLSALFYIFIFANGGLFAEASLNIYYAIISVLGLIWWKNKSDITENTIQKASKTDWIIAACITLGSFIISYLIIKNYTQSTVPLWDSIIASFAWSGSWLLTKRKLENWLVLNISNALAIPLQIQKGFILTSVLTSILFIMAIVGYWQWLKLIKNNQTKDESWRL